ncbi:DUF2062 domain-containing protein [Leptolyngbya sp. AN02str]|uniref:DUF2062 domain-containing protein n=1 Tax=Leptolyngbya sp. AN02str TaxID=3423363 RepID=UPI003D31698B
MRQLRRKPHSQLPRQLRYVYHRLVRIQGSPEAIARGLAVGVFSGCFPWFGIQIVVAIALATLLRGNRIVAAAATWISNPFTYVPIFAFNFQVGQGLLGANLNGLQLNDITSWQAVTELGNELIVPLFVGSSLVGVVLSLMTYGSGLWLIRKARSRRNLRRAAKSKERDLAIASSPTQRRN